MKTLGFSAYTLSLADDTYKDISMNTLNGKGMSVVNADMRGIANGFVPLNEEAKVSMEYLPDIPLTSKAAVRDGTETSLVTTGEKYLWDTLKTSIGSTSSDALYSAIESLGWTSEVIE